MAVAADVNRFEDSTNITGWTAIGGGAGPTAEAPLAYVGTTVVNRKVANSAGRGFQYDKSSDGGGTVDLTQADQAWMCKILVTDYLGLAAADGLEVRVGTSSTVYDTFIIAGTSTPVPRLAEYRVKGGYLVVPINPNITGYRASTSGSPNRAAADFFAAFARHSTPSAKSENLALEAIDIGRGLFGTGTMTDFTDFSSFDQGIGSNRWGFAENDEGIEFYFGTIAVGRNTADTAVATTFTDLTATVVFPDGMFASGFSRLLIDLGSASTVVEIGATVIGRGGDDVVNSRPDHTVVGTAGSYTFTGVLANHRNVTLTSAVTWRGDSTFESLTQGGATIDGAILRPNTAASVAACTDTDFSLLTNSRVVQAGSGHFAEIAGTTAITLTDMSFEGFGADGSTSSALHFTATSGTIDVNVIGGGTPTFTTDGVTVNVIANPVTFQVTVVDVETGSPVENARVYVVAESGGGITPGTPIINGVLTPASGIVSDTRTLSSDMVVSGRVRKAGTSPLYKTGPVSGTVSSVGGLALTIQLIPDE